jgi:hypothetical protein
MVADTTEKSAGYMPALLLFDKVSIKKNRQAPVAHACNPSYSGGRDQEDCDQIAHKTLSQKKERERERNSTKSDWWNGSSDRAPALQV